MNDFSFTPPPPPLPVEHKHSPLGIASSIVSVIAFGLVCVFFGYAYFLGSSGTSIASDAEAILGLALMCAVPFFTMIGLGLGIAALFQPYPNKVFGILGLVFNAILMLGFCGFIGVVLIMLPPTL